MMLDHAEFFNFINFEHNIKVRLELLSTLPYKKNLTKVFLADTRIPMLNYIENLFTLDLFCQLIDFESIIKKALVFRDFNSEVWYFRYRRK